MILAMGSIHSSVENSRELIADLCRKHHVRRLWLFGSAVNGNFDPKTSDLDFLVEFLPAASRDYAGAYFGLLKALQELFQREIDLVEAEPIQNPYFKEAVEETRTALYEAA